jgi:hypothetical protein
MPKLELDGFNLGSHPMTVTRLGRQATGSIWGSDFDKSEGVSCFRKAREFDPESLMAHWGIVYGCGPF